MMKPIEEKYLMRSFLRLHEYLPFEAEEYLEECRNSEDRYRVEVSNRGHVYCLFSYRDPLEMEWIILLVYEEENIIADCSAVCMSASDAIHSDTVYNMLADESDWLYLERELVEEEIGEEDLNNQTVLLFSSIYVTKRYRRNGIFKVMMEMVRDFVADRAGGEILLTTAVSLDPDIACYGEDTPSEPYVYQYEKDEPDRERNRKIIRKIGFVPVCLEEMKKAEGFDGTKCWFALKKEHIVLLEEKR